MQVDIKKKRIQIMGIVNITPDSFYAKSQAFSPQKALEKAQQMVKDGADWIDVGAESSRPGSLSITEGEELDRLLPVLEMLSTLEVPISVDTRKVKVMEAALNYPIKMINDINALQSPQALELIAAHGYLQVCLMHKQGEPISMQESPQYTDCFESVSCFLKERVQSCMQAGISHERLWIDPGFGFGKKPFDNLQLLNNLSILAKMFSVPVLVGLSRKSWLHELTGRAVEDRLAGSLALALIAAQNGAKMLRVHDVKETKDVLKVFERLMETE